MRLGTFPRALATSYAFGDVFGLKHSLHRGFADAKQFYLSYTAMVALAAAIVLIPGAPLGLITTAVQALAGLLLPSASVFLLLLCNDREVLGPWVNRLWLNWVAGLIVAMLLLLSGILMATTLFPDIDVVAVAGYLAAGHGHARRRRGTGAAMDGPSATDTGRPRTPRTRDRRGRPQHLADATLDAVAARDMVTRHPTRHDRPARLPGHRRLLLVVKAIQLGRG